MAVTDSVKKIAVGDVAHDAADSGAPVKVGGYGKATAPTAVNADGDRVNAWFDLNGRLVVNDDATNTKLGIVTEAAPATDTASSGLNGRLQRVAQRLSSLIALMPTALGRTGHAASLPVAIDTETKTAIDTVVNVLPAARGSQTSANSLSVVPASNSNAWAARFNNMATGGFTGSIAASDEEVCVDTAIFSQISMLQWSCADLEDVQLWIYYYDSGGSAVPIAEVKYDGSGITGWTPQNIAIHGSAWWDILEYDTVNSRYKFGLRNLPNLLFPKGFKIKVTNADIAGARLATVNFLYSYWS